MVLPVLFVFLVGAATGFVGNAQFSPKADEFVNKQVQHYEENVKPYEGK